MLSRLVHLFERSPWLWDQTQYRLGGFGEICRRLEPHLARSENQVVLDLGAGTGNFIPLIAPSARYVGLDNDAAKLRRLRRKWPFRWAVRGDAARICLRDKSVEFAFCGHLAHHISDEKLAKFFSELARVLRGELVFVDAVLNPKSLRSRLLCRYDLGAHFRSEEALLAALEAWFDIRHVERYSTWLHDFVLCLGEPRPRD